MDTTTVFLSLSMRILFAGFLATVTFIAVLMTGFSADSGINSVFIYLCVSTLLFAGTGLVCLVTPMEAVSSGSKAVKIIFGLFIFSILQPFIVFMVADFFAKPIVANNPMIPITEPATVCISQNSIDPDNVAWVDVAIGNTSFERFPQNSPLKPRQTSCNVYRVKPTESVKIRAYTSTPANAVEYWTGPAPEDVVSGELEVPISQKEQLCIGVYPTSATPASWKSVKEPCKPLTTQSR
jgi:hypothetical protein